jgi:phosphatidylglycerophosphate synthase
MSTKNVLSLSGKNGQMLMIAMLLLGLVIGIVVWQVTTAPWWVVLCVMTLVLGIFFLITMPYSSNKSDFIPSQRSFRLVWGIILTTVGALLLVNVYATVEWWISAVVLIAIIAVLALIMFMRGSEE